ncbi:NifU family protein [Mycolicibacter arupensis]|uniref:NifU family protein n=1 Tax=Mycolicibacter arupensis TaxID=342002 RepID=UPI003B3BC85E
MIPLHAEATGDPQRVRWVVISDRMPAGGRVLRAPGRLGSLQDDGVIEDVTVHGSDVVITLGPAQRWRDRGDEIRVALDEALRAPTQWRVESIEPTGDLTQMVQELLAGPIGAIAAAHGGAIELVGIRGDQVRVRTSGACRGCPASETTLHDRLQHELRRRFGDQVTVTVASPSTAVTVGRKLLTLFVR